MTPRDVRAPATESEPPRVRFFDVTSADGTRIRAWTNDAAGPAVLLSNGLGANAYSWPDLLRPDCGLRLLSWNHRGVGGSQRPRDLDQIGVHAFVEDAVAVLDTAGVAGCVVVGWSLGVPAAFALAAAHPERVTGLMAVAGVPDDGFAGLGEPLHVPRFVRSAVTVGAARALRHTGRFVSPLTHRIPMTSLTTVALRRSGLMSPRAAHGRVAPAVKEFLTTDVDWYLRLVVASSKPGLVPLSGIRVPTTFVAGRGDRLTGTADVRRAAGRIRGSRLVELDGTHFLPLERGAELRHELLRLAARAGGQDSR